MRKAIAEQKEIDKTLTDKLNCEVVGGENHIFTKHFAMGKTKDGYAMINRKHKVKIIACSEYHETEIKNLQLRKLQCSRWWSVNRWCWCSCRNNCSW